MDSKAECDQLNLAHETKANKRVDHKRKSKRNYKIRCLNHL